MKTLPQMLGDLRGLSDLLLEQAAQIQEIVQFFGGVGGESPPAKPPVSKPAAARTIAPATGTPAEPAVRKTRGSGKSRALNDVEKAAIRRDWAELSPHLRTATNRQALAAKHRVTAQHVFALTRSRPPLADYWRDRLKNNSRQAATSGSGAATLQN